MTLLGAPPPGTIPIARVETSHSRDSTGVIVHNISHEFIFVKYNYYHINHSNIFEMANEQDEPIDQDPNIPPG